MELDYTARSSRTFDETVAAVQEQAQAAGFRVQFVHDVAATLAEKGFERDRVTIIEMCNAKHAAAVLAADVKIGLMLPCPVMVFEEDGEVFVSTMKPTLIAHFFPDVDIADTASEVERAMFAVVDGAAGAAT